MPIIDYRCRKCKNEFEILFLSHSQIAAEELDEKCPKCGSNKKDKLVSKGSSFILKGKGWAKDSYSK